jgi:hypothetical protein
LNGSFWGSKQVFHRNPLPLLSIICQAMRTEFSTHTYSKIWLIFDAHVIGAGKT